MNDPNPRRIDERALPRGRDAMRAPEVDPVPSSGAGAFYLMAGVLIVIVLAVGLLFYSPSPSGDRIDQARQPATAPTATQE